MDELLQVEVVDRSNGVAQVHLVGEMDIASEQSVASVIERLMSDADAQTIVIDLSDVSFCDAAGLGVFAHAQRGAAATGRTIVLANPKPIVGRLFEIVQFGRAVTIDTAWGEPDDPKASAGGADGSETT
jgi:anti-anti-sigma factor